MAFELPSPSSQVSSPVGSSHTVSIKSALPLLSIPHCIATFADYLQNVVTAAKIPPLKSFPMLVHPIQPREINLPKPLLGVCVNPPGVRLQGFSLAHMLLDLCNLAPIGVPAFCPSLPGCPSLTACLLFSSRTHVLPPPHLHSAPPESLLFPHSSFQGCAQGPTPP